MKFLNTIRTRKLLSSRLILFTLSIGILIGTLVNTGVKAAKDQAAPGATPLVIPNPVQLGTAFTVLAKQLEPSVVNISTTYEPKATTRHGSAPGRKRSSPNDEEEGGDESMQDFFNRFGGLFGNNPGGAMPEQRRGQALGSGVIVDPSGYILTNNHVVEKADRIQVTLAGTTTKYTAKLIGADADTDLAVIKIDVNKQLKAAKIGNSDGVQVGDWVVAIGSPFGLDATVTAGIISAKERDLGAGPEHQFQRFLQTDAAINPGNSGGPLLAINGDVIGINTAILSGSGGYQGVGFALPINTAANVYNQIIKTGRVSRGAIGVNFAPEQKPELLAVYGAKEGVFVQDVTPGMPAEKAGVHTEDVIIAINGKPIKDGNELINRVSETPVGSQAKITVLREKKPLDLMVTIGDRQKVVSTSLGIDKPGETEPEKSTVAQAKLGIEMEKLSEARKESMGLKEKGDVWITEVFPGSFAEDIGNGKGRGNRFDQSRAGEVHRRRGSDLEFAQAGQSGRFPRAAARLSTGAARGNRESSEVGKPVRRPARCPIPSKLVGAKLLRKRHWISILPVLFAAALLWAAADSTQTTRATTPKKKTTTAPTSKAPPAPAASAKKSSTKKKSTATAQKKSTTAARKPAAQSWRAAQRAPTPERYKEIQQALASKGYLQTETPSGVWDSSSVDALKKFQQDQNLEPSGKLDSLSIIALGLGPKHDPGRPRRPPMQSPRT